MAETNLDRERDTASLLSIATRQKAVKTDLGNPDDATAAMQIVAGMCGSWDARRLGLRRALAIIDLVEEASLQDPEGSPVSE